MKDGDLTKFSFDLFWSFRSPFCYLALDRILEIERDFNVTVNVRPVFPLAVRTPDFFKNVNQKYRPYHLKDSERVAAFHNIPYRRPVPDPIIQDMETNVISHEQPYIRNLTLLGAAAQILNAGLPFLDCVSRLLWDGTVDGWDKGLHLVNAMDTAGLNGLALVTDIEAEPLRFEAVIEENQRAQEQTDHWGVPLMTFRGETFFGQDRVEMLLWRMEKAGLAKR
jgi:2-hydroxychromene-2-carboxylate isomerase